MNRIGMKRMHSPVSATNAIYH